jgi:erythromycin esterase-like protein
MEIKQVRPSRPDSFERLMHMAEIDAFFLPLSKSKNPQLTAALTARRLERAIGVIYRPETERQSHYFDASLSKQFDEFIWFDETSALQPLTTQQSAEHEPPHPFATIDR